MDFLDIFALIVMAILLAVVIWLVVLLGSMPGTIAEKRGHPQVDAIKALGWIGLITMGIGWFIAIVWAYTVPFGQMKPDGDPNTSGKQPGQTDGKEDLA